MRLVHDSWAATESLVRGPSAPGDRGARVVSFEGDESVPIEPLGPEEIAELARLRQAADDAWTEFLASATPGEEQLEAS